MRSAFGLEARTIRFAFADDRFHQFLQLTVGFALLDDVAAQVLLLGANVLVEKVFAWPGVGSYAVEALLASDYAPIQGFVLTMAILYVALNLLIDILYGVIDPRVRLEA